MAREFPSHQISYVASVLVFDNEHDYDYDSWLKSSHIA